jgi:Outer membrane protein beta-barrel domain
MNRIRYYTLLIAILLSATPAAAQFSVGVIGGANFANLNLTDGGDKEDTSTRTAAAVGIVADYALGENMALSIQPMLLGKGAKQGKTEGFDGVDITLSYIEIPVLFRYLFGSGNIHPFVEAGPSIGFLSSADVKFTNGEKQDIKDQITGVTVAW